MPAERILIIQSMGLGDLLFSIPVIKVLRRQYRDAEIVVLTHHNHAMVLSLVPEINSVISYQEKSFSELLRLFTAVRRKKFSKVFILNPIFRGSLLAWLSGAAERIGYIYDYERVQSLYGLENILVNRLYTPKKEKRHEVDRYLDLLEFYGIQVIEEDRVPSLSVADTASSGQLPSRLPQKKAVIVNLGAGWKNRLWPQDRILLLSQALADQYGCQLYFSGGGSEFAFAEEVIKSIPNSGVNLCGKTTLPQLATYLAKSNLFITSDTGSLHIAAALNVPTIALFGPGDLAKVYPRSPSITVLQHPMPCSPCRFQYTSRCGENLCMKEISIEEVLNAAGKTLGIPFTNSAKVLPLNLRTKKRILYLQSTSEVGGTDVTLLRTLEALNKNHFEPHVLQPQEGPFSEAYRKLGCKVHFMTSMRKMTRRKGIFHFFRYMFGYLPAVWRITNLIKKESIDLVHTNTIHNLYGFFAAKLAKVPHVWHIREIVVQSSWMKHLEVFLVKNFSTKFIVMDNAISEMFLTKNSGYPSNIVKLYDGVDLNKFNPNLSGSRIRKDLAIPENAYVVGTVGRLDPWKGLDLIIDAAQLVSQKLPHTHFILCGGEIEGHAGYGKKLREKIISYGLEKCVHITGWRYFGNDIPEVYRSLDISLQCPAFPEPYGLANIEAMASGIPTIAKAEGGPVEICDHQKTGLLISSAHAEALADAIIALLKEPARRHAMGTGGRLRAEALFDSIQCTRNLEAIYADIFVTHKKDKHETLNCNPCT